MRQTRKTPSRPKSTASRRSAKKTTSRPKAITKLVSRHKLAFTGLNVLVAAALFSNVFALNVKPSTVMQAQAQSLNEINLDDPADEGAVGDETPANQGDILTNEGASVTPGAGSGSVNSDGLAELQEIETLNTSEKLEIDDTGAGEITSTENGIGNSAGLTTYSALVSDLDMKEKLVLAYAVMSFIFFTGATAYFIIRQELWFLSPKQRT